MIYPIVDMNECNPIPVAKACVRAEVPFLQLRGKNVDELEFIDCAKALRDITAKTSTKFIINDNVKVALEVRADGVHLGQRDMSIQNARNILGKHAIIGQSQSHMANRWKQLQIAEEPGQSGDQKEIELVDEEIELVDYVAFGPVFWTQRKAMKPPIGVEKLKELVKLAKSLDKIVFAIGGINHQNCLEVMESGCDGIAAIGAVCHAQDPYSACLGFKKLCKFQ